MRQLILGKQGALKASPVEAVQALMRTRAGDGKFETPDAPCRAVGAVTVKVYAPKVDAFLNPSFRGRK